MAKIEQLSIIDKPREKAIRFGLNKLTDAELLALIINCGTVGHSSLEIAQDLLKLAQSLTALSDKPYQYFQMFKGLNKVRALNLAAVMEIAKRINEKRELINEEKIAVTSDSLYHRYSISLANEEQECFAIVILNKNKQIIFETNLYKGNDDKIILSHRQILRLLCIHNGRYFYLIHNHPAGSLIPSQYDVSMTKTIQIKAEKIGVKLLDHLIISQNGYYSFVHSELLKQ